MDKKFSNNRLCESFERLKTRLNEIEEELKAKVEDASANSNAMQAFEAYAKAYGSLSGAVTIHLIDSPFPEDDIIDMPLFQQNIITA